MPFRLVLRLVVARIESQCGERVLGTLAAVPLTVHLYHRLWPPEISDEHRRRPDRRAASIRAGEVEGEYESSGIDGRSGRGE